MDLINAKEFEEYIIENYNCIFEGEDSSISQELAGICDSCQRDVFLKVYSREFQIPYSTETNFPRFVNVFIECPSCRKKSFLQAVQFVEQIVNKIGNSRTYKYIYRLYKLYRIPVSNEHYINGDIPNEYISLRKTATEADYCLGNSKFIASAILFRRAIQILAKDVLGGKGNTLFKQLEWLKTNENAFKIDLSEMFHENAKIIKDYCIKFKKNIVQRLEQKGTE